MRVAVDLIVVCCFGSIAFLLGVYLGGVVACRFAGSGWLVVGGGYFAWFGWFC